MTTTSERAGVTAPAGQPATRPVAPSGRIPATGPESTTGRHDLPVLEAYRGLAAVMVVITHVGFTSGAGVIGPWAGWISRLDFGVALFFLLSGFLLFRPFVQAAYGRRAPVAVGAYLRRRFVRIYPALLIAIAANYLLTPQARHQSSALWWQTVFLVQNYPGSFNSQLAGLVQLWSLVVEVSFYAALPILAWVLVGLPRRRSGAGAGGQIVAPGPSVQGAEAEWAPSTDQRAGRALSRRELRELEANQRSVGNRLKPRSAAASTSPSAAGSASPSEAVSDAVPAAVLASASARPATVPVTVSAALLPPAVVKSPADWRPLAGLITMAVIAMVWRIYYVEFDIRGGTASQLLWLPPFLDWFAVGMGMAWLRERPSPVPAPIRQLADAPGVCWSLALAGYWLTTTALGGPMDLTGATTGENLTKHIVYAIVGTLLLLPAIFGDPRQAWREVANHRFFVWLGQVSFGVFLWHPMLMEVIRRLLRMPIVGGGFWLTLVLTLAASGIVATLSWRYVEAPLQRRWRNGFGIRGRRPKVIDLRDSA